MAGARGGFSTQAHSPANLSPGLWVLGGRGEGGKRWSMRESTWQPSNVRLPILGTGSFRVLPLAHGGLGPRGAGGHQAPLSPLLGGSGEHGGRQFTGLEDEVD